MIETPALFPAMTAYQNMEIQRIQRGIPDKTVIKRTLDMVGLNDTGKRGFEIFLRDAAAPWNCNGSFEYPGIFNFR